MKGIGLVFAGGGGKGAYEIGVWKYLHEIGLDQYVRVVSGTSVGALNAALFVGSSYELAEKLWLTISQDKILTPREISPQDIIKWLISNGITLSSPILAEVGQFASQASLIVEKIAIKTMANILGDHIFSRKGIIRMIDDGLNFDRLKSSSIPCYVTCLKCQQLQIQRFLLNEYNDQDITTLLLATSAIPLIFPNEEFQGQKYCDGGLPLVGDNVPVEPVYKTGVNTIIVIHLSQDCLLDKEKFPNAKIIEIVPSEDLGNILTGTLDFGSEGSSTRIKLGYEDAKRIMLPLVDMMYMNAVNSKMLEVAKQKNYDFENKRQILVDKSNEIKENMLHDEFDILFSSLMEGKNNG